MKKYSTPGRFIPPLIVVVAGLLITLFSSAQLIRSYTQIYSDNHKGGHTMFGNTILARDIAAMNEFLSPPNSNGTTSTSGNDNNTMNNVDIDAGATSITFQPFGGLWRYYSLNNYTTAPPDVSGINWRQDTYNDASNWTNTAANANAFGYGETGVNSPAQTNRETYYLRRDITITNPLQYQFITLTARYDDGAIVFVNGVEVARINMPAGTPVYGTNPSISREYGDGDFVLNIPSSNFINGNNQIAVELYQGTSATIDFYFDMKLENITFNSSSADLILPAGTNTIKFARLYWGGRISSGMGGADNFNIRNVKIRKGSSGTYHSIAAPSAQIDKALVSGTSGDSTYQAYIDVTAYMNSNGAGTYTVANVTAATGSISGGGYFAGWGIMVVYQNNAMPFSSIRLYDGYLQVYDGGSPVTQSITLTGLNAPDTAISASDAFMTTMSWEGDANLAVTTGNPAGDYIKLNGTVATNSVNPATNFWNGTISKNGVFVTTKNPDYKNQMSVDIDELEVGTGFGILPEATTITVEFGTEADQYFPSVFAFSMKSKDPSILIDKSVTSSIVPYNLLNPNEILTYTLSGSNTGMGHSYNCIITDTIPGSLTYVPGSLTFLSSPGGIKGLKTDAAGDDEAMIGISGTKTYVKFYVGDTASGSHGGTLASGETYAVQFQCLTPPNANVLNSVSNTARITGLSFSGEQYVDDGTALIGPEGSPLSVKLTLFKVNKEIGNAILKWTTMSETKNDRFEVERSNDGINFTKIGLVYGNGTTADKHDYSYYDEINNLNVRILYYRLRVVDLDGKSSFSKIIALRLEDNSLIRNYQLFPNPFKSDIKLNINSLKETSIIIRISNTSGQVLLNRTITLQHGQNIVVLNDLDAIQPGMHLLEIITEEGKVSQRIIKQ